MNQSTSKGTQQEVNKEVISIPKVRFSFLDSSMKEDKSSKSIRILIFLFKIIIRIFLRVNNK